MENMVKNLEKSIIKSVATICIPVYNGENTLKQALDSICSARNCHFNVLVVDNASTDNTVHICREYAHKYSSIFSYYKNKENLGFAGNYRRCIELAKTDYIFFMGADDFLFIRGVEELIIYLDKNKDIDLVCSDLVQFYDSPMRPTRKEICFSGKKKIFSAGDDALTNWILNSVLGSIGGYLIRTEIAKKYISFLPPMSIVPQIYLGMMIAGSHRVAHLPLFSFAQRLTDDTTQLANKQYSSLSIIDENLVAIDLVTDTRWKSKIKNSTEAKKRLIDIYMKGLIENIVSYRCFSSFSNYVKFVILIPKYSKKSFFSLIYIKYVFASLFIPKKVLKKMLVRRRRQNRV